MVSDDQIRKCADSTQQWINSHPHVLGDHDKSYLRNCAIRYSTARGGHEENALKALKETIEWRKLNSPVHLTCEACDVDPYSHCFMPIGVATTPDGKRSPLIYACPRRAKIATKQVTINHMTHTLDHIFRYTESVQNSSDPALNFDYQYVWIVDFNSFSFSNVTEITASSIGFLKAFSDHYPERLRLIILLDPPKVFNLLFSTLRTFADARTLAKVRIVSKHDEFAELGIPVDSPESNWLLKVMGMKAVPGSLPSFEGLDLELLSKICLPHQFQHHVKPFLKDSPTSD